MNDDRGLSLGKRLESTNALDFANNRAYVIGINAYSNGIPTLRTAVADSERLGQLLHEFHGYKVRLIPRDGTATLAGLRQLLCETMQQEVGPNDRVLFYFAGHGIALDGDDGPEGYLVPEDAKRDDRTSFLGMTELHDALAKLPCRHLLLILDCCFAGAFRWSSMRDISALPSVIHRERFERYIHDPAWQVLTSAAHDQTALDVLSGNTIGERIESDAHSPFAAALFRALAGDADLIPRSKDGQPGGDGVITATELYLYLRECVESATVEHRTRQTPGLWPLKKHDKGEYILLTPGHTLNLPPAPLLDEKNNPYRGLQSYDEEHAAMFFGRSRFVTSLSQRVKIQALTIVLGASGTGKSSVVKAGLLPLLRSKEPNVWVILPPFRPGKSPLASLATLTLPNESNEPDVIDNRLRHSHSDPDALARRVGDWAAMAAPHARLVIVVDQFEELLTLCGDMGEREQFLRQIDRALATFPDRVRILLTLRSDFEPQFAKGPLQEEWLPARVVVPVMTLDEYREAIEGPASLKVLYLQGRSSSQAFIDRLIGDVANTPGALPLLSFTLSELYRRYLARRGDDRALLEIDYEALEGVGGSLRKRADEVYTDLPDDGHRATMRRVMLRMISVEGGELARRRVPDEELVYESPEENLRVQEVLSRLTGARLVVEGKEINGEPFIEPAHDELLRGWSKFLEWCREDAENLQLRRRLTPASLAWDQRYASLWLVEPRLNVLKQVLDTPANWLNKSESRFLRQCFAVRRTIAIASASFLILAFIVITTLGLFANAERERALTALDESQHALGRSLLSPIGIAPRNSGDFQIPDVTVREAEALWNVAVLADERVRLLLLKQALEKFTTAVQLRNRLDSIVHCAVGLDGGRRLRVINEIILPFLRDRRQSHEPIDVEVRMACVEIGDQLEAFKTSSRAEFSHLSVEAAIDVVKSQSEPDPRAVVTFRRNVVNLTRRELEVIHADLETFLKAHSTTNATLGIEIERGPIIGLMLLELKRRLHADHSTSFIAPSEASGPLELNLSIAEEQFKDHQLFLNPQPSSGEGRFIPALSNRGAVAMVLEMRNLNVIGPTMKPVPIREKWKYKPKYSNPTSDEAFAESEALLEEIRKPEPDYFDNSVAIIDWVLRFDTIAARIPEEPRRILAQMLIEKILLKTTKTELIADFSEAFVILANIVGPDVTYEYILRILSAQSEMLSGWEKPGAHATQSVEKSYVFGTLLLRNRLLILDKARLLNILKYPFCVGAQKEIVLARFVEQIRTQPETPFGSEWDLLSWLEAHDPALAKIAKQPPRGPARLTP